MEESTIADYFQKVGVEWAASEARFELRRILKEHLDKDQYLPHVTKLLGFALGAFHEPHANYTKTNQRHMMRHHLFLEVQKLLGEKFGKDTIETVAQGSGYWERENDLLSRHRVTTEPNPMKSLLAVDKKSVVVAIEPYMPVKQIITDISMPAVILWSVETGDSNDIKPLQEKMWHANRRAALPPPGQPPPPPLPAEQEWQNRKCSKYVSIRSFSPPVVTIFPPPPSRTASRGVSSASHRRFITTLPPGTTKFGGRPIRVGLGRAVVRID